MSPRNDNILSLCLAQAELSPLHYRHGAVVIRGGKVIGQGFNTYRPGFDGGALKTGILKSAPALRELEERLKKTKTKGGFKPDYQQDSSTFTPFETSGSGHNANTPLSMHSEMMAIQSALSLSSGTQSSQTSARAARYLQKPCFSLQGDSKKRKARARGLELYAEAVCGGECSVQKQGFEPGSSQSGVQGEERGQRNGGGRCVTRGGSAVHSVENGEECRETPNEEESGRGGVWTRVQHHLSSQVYIPALSVSYTSTLLNTHS